MRAPIHLLVAIHYWTTPGDWDGEDREIINELVEAGLLHPSNDGKASFKGTDGLRVYIEALLAVPYPVQEWVLPSIQSKGGHARAAKLSPEQRSDIARKAALTRWDKP